MIPIETYYSNIIFSAEGCKDLHGTLLHNEDGSDEIETCWKLTEEELKHIAQTGCIYLYTMGRWLPPVLLSVTPKVTTDGVKEYGRFDGYGERPPEKNGDYAWLMHILKSLKRTGKAAVILPHGVLFRGNAEGTIRENLIKTGY